MPKAREPAPTVACIDASCAHYPLVFPNVRQFEQFTRREWGVVAETKGKSLPRLAQTTTADPQAFPPSSRKPSGWWRSCAACGGS